MSWLIGSAEFMGLPLGCELRNLHFQPTGKPAFSPTRPTTRPGLSLLPGLLNLAVDALFCDSRRSGLPCRGAAGGFSIAAGA